MNFAIRYLTNYDYDAEVVDNLNALRVRPTANDRQRLDEFSVRLTPEVRLHRHTDYFGTEVVEFEVSRPHRHLTIDVRARVATKPSGEPPQSSWKALDEPGYREAGGEFLFQTDDATTGAGGALLDDLVTQTRAATPLHTVLRVSEAIPDRFEYRRGATFVDSRISDLLEAGAGVCQDFVHLGLCLLRHHGIAARYVSGYLFAAGGDDSRESVEVETHAWLEALLPVGRDQIRDDSDDDGSDWTRGDGDRDAAGDGTDPIWVGVDPTNRMMAGETHVKIGHGRHYIDVPPIKGVYRGQASAELEASVAMTRLERTDPASIARP